MSINRNIYFVCRGLSCNDIIESINKDIKPNKSFFNFTQTESINKLKVEEFSRLDTIGIKELIINIENPNNEEYLDIKNNPLILTSLEYSAIESGFVLYHKDPQKTIYPICNISNKTGIKDSKSLDIYKRKFGFGYDEKLAKKYWAEKKITSNLYQKIGDKVPKINWKFVDENKSNLNTYSLKNFMDFLMKICVDNKYKNQQIIIICDSKLILEILKKLKKYEKTDIIEYSSIWKMELFSKNQDFKKIYPTEFNYAKPLIYDNDTYKYEFDKKKFILFDSLKPIPINYIQINNYRCLIDKKELISQLLRKNKNNNENIVERKENNIDNNSLYENILKKELDK